MNTMTHLYISKSVQKVIESKMNIKLNSIGFLYGNIKPDISSSYIKIPHYKEDSINFLKREIKEMISYRFTRLPKCTKQFSERLGVITHYLSDYFCHAHSKQFSGNMVEHYFYESKLSQFYKANSGNINSFNDLETTDIAEDYEAVCNCIEDLHSKYLKSGISFESDILFALNICVTVCLFIVSSCMNQKADTAA
ncbi:MAG: zinc dependent phospholipase C family protein [Clostridia bacterium]|nr:zinc dependent phospholipase C family protein [Clostridia bacterium]